MVLEEAYELVNQEYLWAETHFPSFHSAHEGLAVIEEEFEELKKEVFKKPPDRDLYDMAKEARQVAAMAIRFLIDIC